jgi:hypothetical protein
VYIDKNDTIYVADSQSDDKTNLQTGHSDWKRQGW